MRQIKPSTSKFSPQAYTCPFANSPILTLARIQSFLCNFPLCREKFERSSFRTEFKLIKDSKINFISYLFFALDQNLSLLWKAVVKGCDKIGPFAKTPRACHCPGPPTLGSCIASSVYISAHSWHVGVRLLKEATVQSRGYRMYPPSFQLALTSTDILGRPHDHNIRFDQQRLHIGYLRSPH